MADLGGRYETRRQKMLCVITTERRSLILDCLLQLTPYSPSHKRDSKLQPEGAPNIASPSIGSLQGRDYRRL